MDGKKATLCINYDCLRQTAVASTKTEVNVVALTNCEAGN